MMGEDGGFGGELAYLYDGSLEGLLSAVFMAYLRHEVPSEVVVDSCYQPRIAQESLVVQTDFQRALRVRRGIVHRVGCDAFTAVLRASTCDDYAVGTVIYRFIRYVINRPDETHGTPVLEELANPVVADLLRYAKHAVNECERMRQFVRFSLLENGVWFARCNPNATVVPLVMGYFSARLNDQPFIIFDESHRLAGVYDGSSWELVSGDAVNAPPSTEHDEQMQEAWKRFYDALSVDARYNPELRRHFMPVRLWGNIVEMQPRG